MSPRPRQKKQPEARVTPEDQARELMKFLESSNLHYAAQVTPFSMYITVRKSLGTLPKL